MVEPTYQCRLIGEGIKPPKGALVKSQGIERLGNDQSRKKMPFFTPQVEVFYRFVLTNPSSFLEPHLYQRSFLPKKSSHFPHQYPQNLTNYSCQQYK